MNNTLSLIKVFYLYMKYDKHIYKCICRLYSIGASLRIEDSLFAKYCIDLRILYMNSNNSNNIISFLLDGKNISIN